MFLANFFSCEFQICWDSPYVTQEFKSHGNHHSESESPVSGGSSSAKKSDDSNRLLVIQQNNELEKRLAFEISRFNTAKKSTPNLGMFSNVCL